MGIDGAFLCGGLAPEKCVITVANLHHHMCAGSGKVNDTRVSWPVDMHARKTVVIKAEATYMHDVVAL